MKNNISSLLLLTVDTIWFNVNWKEEKALNPEGAPKKMKQNKIRRYTAIITLSIFLAEVIKILHRI